MPFSHFLDHIRYFLGKQQQENEKMGGRTRICQLSIFLSVFFLLLTLVTGSFGSVSANTNSSEVADNVKNAAADTEEIRERLAKTFILLGEWEKYGIPPETQPIKPAEQPEKPDAGIIPEEPPEKPTVEAGYKILLPPPENGKAPISRLLLPEEKKALIGTLPVSLPPSGRVTTPSIYGIAPPTKPPAYFAVSTVRAPLYMKPMAAISPVAVAPTSGRYPLYIPPAVSPDGIVTSPLITAGEGGAISSETVEKTLGIAKQGLDVAGGIFDIVINNTYILYTIIVCIFSAVIGKLAGWQVGLIGGSALAVAFTMFSDGGTTLMPAFITGIVVLGSAAMISMAVSKMAAG